MEFVKTFIFLSSKTLYEFEKQLKLNDFNDYQLYAEQNKINLKCELCDSDRFEQFLIRFEEIESIYNKSA